MALAQDNAKDMSPEDLTYLQAVLGTEHDTMSADFFAAAAQEILIYKAFEPAQEVAKRRDVILTRAHSRLQAAQGRTLGEATQLLRRGQSASDIHIQKELIPYSHFFATTELTLTYTRFDGTRSEPMERGVFLMADAVTVLPYDPVRDRVLLIEQFRIGPFARGDQYPWVLEPIAGRLDVGQTPEQTARREAVEEARLTLGDLHLIGQYYPSPGAVTEHLTSYVAIADLPDDITGLAGLAHEQEDIASSLVSFEALMDMADIGALDTGPLFTSALWLARHRDRLRG